MKIYNKGNNKIVKKKKEIEEINKEIYSNEWVQAKMVRLYKLEIPSIVSLKTALRC